MYKYKKGISYQFDVKGLGEFRFIFSRNYNITKGTDKYYFESYWNPERYGLVDFIVGYYVDNIEDEVKRLSHDLSYFIDGARISCICRIEADNDDEGVYEGILNDYFDEEYVQED
jgi:hypothetical protein